ncbi:hypothetical protein [Mucilaginibacter flavus]|uniref:hypothetical protein n=1 Tax=Mucilaginibacter flavus TaxID=931504 RepID=UPI0025B6239E|nr:hypothetical protein [Mucilaginibacter flavus]MDN3584238.1 hypothetical protein [Mucilaginibacter flavus]
MPNARSTILFFTIIILSGLSAYNAYAQYPGMAAFRAQQNQQLMTQQMQLMQMNMYGNWRKNAGQGQGYIVTLKDGQRKTIKSYMFLDTVLHKNFLVFVDKKFPKADSAHRFQKIYPDQTSNIAALVTDAQGNEEAKYGLPSDSGWTVKVMTGAINIYAKSGNYLKVVSFPAFSAPKMGFVDAEIIGIQLNDGPIEKLSKENVLKIVTGNAKATEYVEKKGLYEAVKRYNNDAEKAAGR